MQEWIQKHLVPVINKITSMYWFGIIADAILYIVPFSMVSTIPSLWTILRRFIPSLPDLTPISTYSFGLIGLFVTFIIPYNVLVKENKKDRSLIAGFTGIGTYMMCMNFVATDEGSLVSMSKFGAGGMFTAMVVGVMVGAIYKAMIKFSFFKEDSVIPDFVKNWFDNIIAIILSLFVGYIITYALNVDLFTLVQWLMKPITGFAQSIWGVVLIVFLQKRLYIRISRKEQKIVGVVVCGKPGKCGALQNLVNLVLVFLGSQEGPLIFARIIFMTGQNDPGSCVPSRLLGIRVQRPGFDPETLQFFFNRRSQDFIQRIMHGAASAAVHPHREKPVDIFVGQSPEFLFQLCRAFSDT